jgi:hypothetical protein
MPIDTRTPRPGVAGALLAAGLWNIGGASLMLAMPGALLPLAFPNGAGPIGPLAQFHITSLWLFVGLIGAALLLGIRAPRDVRGVMLLSAVGRLAFVGLVLAYWLRGDASAVLALACGGELALAAALLWAYRRTGA